LLYCLFPLPKSDQPFFPSRSGRREVGLHFVEEGWFVEKGLWMNKEGTNEVEVSLQHPIEGFSGSEVDLSTVGKLPPKVDLPVELKS
jgi:hypothetical protein